MKALTNASCGEGQMKMDVVKEAQAILKAKLKKTGLFFSEPGIVKDFLFMKYCQRKTENVGLMHLTSQNQLIKEQIIFRGSVNICQVYTREIAASILKNNSAAIIMFHNHPSGDHRPSDEDKLITDKVIKLCDLLGVRFHDHVIIGHRRCCCFSESWQ